MADMNVAVTLTAKDEASPKINEVGKTASKVSGIVSKFGSVGGKALETFSQAATGLMATKDLILTARDAMLGFVEKALEFRTETDALSVAFKRQANEVNALSARIGDVLLNAFIAVTEQFEPLITSAREFLVANQQMLAIGLVEFFEDVANVVVNSVSKSIVYATRIVTFFQVAWETLKVGVNGVIGAILFGISELLIKANGLVQSLPLVPKAVKEGMGDAIRAVDGLSMAFIESADESKNAIGTILDEQDKLEFTVGKVSTTIQREIGEKSKIAIQALGTATVGLNQPFEQIQAAAEATGEAIKETVNEATEDTGELIAGLTSVMDVFRGAAAEADSFGQALFSGTVEAIKQTTNLLIDAVRKEVIARAVAAYTAAASGAAGFGPVAMGVAGAAALSLIMGLVDRIPAKFADGGMVRGGVPGTDSVPALLMPGEYVMNVDQVDAMRKLFANMDGTGPTNGRYQDGGTVVNQTAGGVTVNISSATLPTKAEVTRYVRSTIVPAMNELRAQRII